MTFFSVLFCMVLSFFAFFFVYFLDIFLIFLTFLCIISHSSLFSWQFFLCVFDMFLCFLTFFSVWWHISFFFNMFLCFLDVTFRIFLFLCFFHAFSWVALATMCVRLPIKFCIFRQLLRNMHMKDHGLRRFWWAVSSHQEHQDCFCALLSGMCHKMGFELNHGSASILNEFSLVRSMFAGLLREPLYQL